MTVHMRTFGVYTVGNVNIQHVDSKLTTRLLEIVVCATT
jgi:hypothetical protein